MWCHRSEGISSIKVIYFRFIPISIHPQCLFSNQTGYLKCLTSPDSMHKRRAYSLADTFQNLKAVSSIMTICKQRSNLYLQPKISNRSPPLHLFCSSTRTRNCSLPPPTPTSPPRSSRYGHRTRTRLRPFRVFDNIPTKFQH